MNRQFSLLIITFSVIAALPGCEPFLIITSSYHAPQMKTPESISRFAKKNEIIGFQMVRFDTSF